MTDLVFSVSESSSSAEDDEDPSARVAYTPTTVFQLIASRRRGDCSKVKRPSLRSRSRTRGRNRYHSREEAPQKRLFRNELQREVSQEHDDEITGQNMSRNRSDAELCDNKASEGQRCWPTSVAEEENNADFNDQTVADHTNGCMIEIYLSKCRALHEEALQMTKRPLKGDCAATEDVYHSWRELICECTAFITQLERCNSPSEEGQRRLGFVCNNLCVRFWNLVGRGSSP